MRWHDSPALTHVVFLIHGLLGAVILVALGSPLDLAGPIAVVFWAILVRLVRRPPTVMKLTAAPALFFGMMIARNTPMGPADAAGIRMPGLDSMIMSCIRQESRVVPEVARPTGTLPGRAEADSAGAYADFVAFHVLEHWKTKGSVPRSLIETVAAPDLAAVFGLQELDDVFFWMLRPDSNGVWVRVQFCGADRSCGSCDDVVITYREG